MTGLNFILPQERKKEVVNERMELKPNQKKKKETNVFWKANLRGRIFISNRPVLRSKNENDLVIDSLRKEHKRVPCSQSSGAVRKVCRSNLMCKPKNPSLFLTFTETCLD